VARALDVVGDRWSLLIVRDLLARGPSRYTDLRHGLPGIASNLLVDRLRDLVEAGVIARETAPPPIAADLYRLTPRGDARERVLQELGRWGAPLLGPRKSTDEFHAHWLALAARQHLHDSQPDAPPVCIEIRSGGEALTIEATGGAVRTRPGAADHPALVLDGAPELVAGALIGRLSLRAAAKAGLHVRGDRQALQRFHRRSPSDGEQTP
jgi:DNA-binding HxlR family transcriptional regulator